MHPERLWRDPDPKPSYDVVIDAPIAHERLGL